MLPKAEERAIWLLHQFKKLGDWLREEMVPTNSNSAVETPRRLLSCRANRFMQVLVVDFTEGRTNCVVAQ